MSKKAIVGAILAFALVCILLASVISFDWGVAGGPVQVPFGLDQNGNLPVNSINFQMFEVFGPVLMVLAVLMFGAIIAGVCISKEEEKKKEGQE